jgi:DNA-binding MarR family transcriptional regulator
MVPEAVVVDALERVVFGAVGLTAVALEQARPRAELTLPQWRVLVVVGGGAGSLRVGEVAARLGSTVPSTSRLLRRMEERGLIATQRDETDRRATLVRLTPVGEAVRGGLVRRRRRLIRELLRARGAPLPADLPNGLEAIAAALGRYA